MCGLWSYTFRILILGGNVNLKWPCGHCKIIDKHPYGHYYGICDGCKKLEEYEAWKERKEMKKMQTMILQKSKKIKTKE